MQHTRCNRCGCLEVQWRQTKAGRWYMALSVLEPTPEDAAWLRGGGGHRPHKCENHARHDAAREQRIVDYYAQEAALTASTTSSTMYLRPSGRPR